MARAFRPQRTPSCQDLLRPVCVVPCPGLRDRALYVLCASAVNAFLAYRKLNFAYWRLPSASVSWSNRQPRHPLEVCQLKMNWLVAVS